MMLGVKHSGQLGDIIYSMSFLRSFLIKNSIDKAVIFIPSDKKANHAAGLNHIGGSLMISKSMFEFVRELLVAQTYIHDVIYLPEINIPKGVLDLDLIRNGLINLSAGNIKSYYFKIFGMIDRNSGSWIDVNSENHVEDFDAIIGRSTRYVNLGIDYSNINKLSIKVGFIGTDFEFDKILEINPQLAIKKVNVRNAFEAATIIKKSKVYIGNQSFFFAIAEALAHPRLLECFEPVPNVVSTPGCSGAFLTNSAMINMLIEILNLPAQGIQIADMNPQYLLSF
jgi:hypothetical protein